MPLRRARSSTGWAPSRISSGSTQHWREVPRRPDQPPNPSESRSPSSRPEATMTVEAIVAAEPPPRHKDREPFWWTEVVALMILAAASVLTAWSAYQSTRWSGEMAISSARPTRIRAKSVADEHRGRSAADHRRPVVPRLVGVGRQRGRRRSRRSSGAGSAPSSERHLTHGSSGRRARRLPSNRFHPGRRLTPTARPNSTRQKPCLRRLMPRSSRRETPTNAATTMS